MIYSSRALDFLLLLQAPYKLLHASPPILLLGYINNYLVLIVEGYILYLDSLVFIVSVYLYCISYRKFRYLEIYQKLN